MRVGFHTFGCKLNQFETEALASALRSKGYRIVRAEQAADAYIVNTCTVTTRADHKARALVRALVREHPDSTVFVTGCSAQVEAEALAGIAGNVVVVPQDRKSGLPSLLAGGDAAPLRIAEALSRSGPSDPFALRAPSLSFHARAYLKIQDGCDGACAYCRVPLARGPSVCLEAEEAVRRAVELEASGFRELVLTGVNVSSYRWGGVDLAGLLRQLLSATAIARIRVSSLEPETISQDIAAALSHPRICPHFHLPVQSGCDQVLRRMRRRYTATRVREAVALLRVAKRDPFLAADLIAGYPGEGAEDFALTRRLVEEAGFSALHVFPFSPRPGTPAATLLPPVPESERTNRARELIRLSRKLTDDYVRRWLGNPVEVLLERTSAQGVQGVSENYLKVRVLGVPDGASWHGRIAQSRVVGAPPDPRVPCTAEFQRFSA